jgi:hypothetical protein
LLQYLKHSGKVTNNDKVFQFFHKTLNRFTPSVWELDDSQDCSQSASLRKLIFLRMLVVMVRNLPSLQDGDSASSNCPLVIDNPRLRRDLLMSLFVNGTTAEVAYLYFYRKPKSYYTIISNKIFI